MVATYRSEAVGEAGVLVGVVGVLFFPQAVANRASTAAAHSAAVFPSDFIGCRTRSAMSLRLSTMAQKHTVVDLSRRTPISTRNRGFWSCFFCEIYEAGVCLAWVFGFRQTLLVESKEGTQRPQRSQ